MRSTDPAARYREVQRAADAGIAPSDPLLRELFDLLAGNPARDPVTEAYDLYQTETHRVVMDAFIVASATPQLIESVLGVKVEVVDIYAYLFFDKSVFRNRLELLSYAASYPGDAHAQELMRAAVNVGLEYLLWAYGRGDVQVDARSIIRHTMAEAYYRGMAHRGNALTSGITRESHKWWATAVKNAELLERIDPRAEKHAFEEIRIQLEKADTTYTTETAPVPVTDILH